MLTLEGYIRVWREGYVFIELPERGENERNIGTTVSSGNTFRKVSGSQKIHLRDKYGPLMIRHIMYECTYYWHDRTDPRYVRSAAMEDFLAIALLAYNAPAGRSGNWLRDWRDENRVGYGLALMYLGYGGCRIQISFP